VQVAGAPRDSAAMPDADQGSAGTTLEPSSPNAILLQPVPPTPPGTTQPRQPPAAKPVPPPEPPQDPGQRLAPSLR
jgi:hypothetical protein